MLTGGFFNDKCITDRISQEQIDGAIKKFKSIKVEECVIDEKIEKLGKPFMEKYNWLDPNDVTKIIKIYQDADYENKNIIKNMPDEGAGDKALKNALSGRIKEIVDVYDIIYRNGKDIAMNKIFTEDNFDAGFIEKFNKQCVAGKYQIIDNFKICIDSLKRGPHDDYDFFDKMNTLIKIKSIYSRYPKMKLLTKCYENTLFDTVYSKCKIIKKKIKSSPDDSYFIHIYDNYEVCDRINNFDDYLNKVIKMMKCYKVKHKINFFAYKKLNIYMSNKKKYLYLIDTDCMIESRNNFFTVVSEDDDIYVRLTIDGRDEKITVASHNSTVLRLLYFFLVKNHNFSYEPSSIIVKEMKKINYTHHTVNDSLFDDNIKKYITMFNKLNGENFDIVNTLVDKICHNEKITYAFLCNYSDNVIDTHFDDFQNEFAIDLQYARSHSREDLYFKMNEKDILKGTFMEKYNVDEIDWPALFENVARYKSGEVLVFNKHVLRYSSGIKIDNAMMEIIIESGAFNIYKKKLTMEKMNNLFDFYLYVDTDYKTVKAVEEKYRCTTGLSNNCELGDDFVHSIGYIRNQKIICY